MTLLAKLTILFNVGISLLLAFAALHFYFNGVDWAYDVTKPNQVEGLVKAKKDEIAEVQKIQVPTEGTWKSARPMLWKQEQERRDARAFFVKEMDQSRNKATKDDPARVVVLLRTKEGEYRAKRDAKNPLVPEMAKARVRGEKAKEDELPFLESRAIYQADLRKHHQDNLVLLDKLKKEFQKDEDYTRMIYDDKTKTGLQVDLIEERTKRQGVEAERRLVKPLYVNTMVESALSRKRLASMQTRIDELKAYCKKRGMDVELTKR